MKTALKQFITKRVLTDEQLLMKYTHGKCQMPSGKFEMMYKDELRKITLYRILLLVVFLDKAKINCLIESSPRLFNKSAMIKSSKEFLAMLCRDYLHGIGSLFKHLSQIGVIVSHEQTYIDELDFSISNLAVDLRDGVVLGKLTESLSGISEQSILTTMRLPAVSRLQKVHNAQIVLSSLSSLLDIEGLNTVHPNHIVDGHRPQVLKMLWSIISSFKLPSLLDMKRLRKEIHTILRSNTNSTKSISVAKIDSCHDICDLLLHWCQAVCSCYGHKVDNFSSSFANGKTLCLLIHYYHPGMLNLAAIQPTILDTKVNNMNDQEKRNLLNNERKNSELAKQKMIDIGGIPSMYPVTDSLYAPDTRSTIICVTYLCARLLESSLENFSTIVIQKSFKLYQRKKVEGKQKDSVLKIERCWSQNRSRYFVKQKKIYKKSVDVIEQFILSKKNFFETKRMQVRYEVFFLSLSIE
jgi:abnormal spindle-like microcephaly-associated protein